MDNVKTNKTVKTMIQFALGLLCGYLVLMAFNAFQEQPKGAQKDGTPILETVVGY